MPDSGQPGMFPAWGLLRADNDEPPVEEPDETACWHFARIEPGPMTGPWTMEVDWVQHERRVR